ncbi:MAG: amidohydrolase family protein [Maribacter sp.]|uniref:amidohydrolase family protein n=1 Tax=Maribacter sp. TaxID=1897614 RepID=UPI003297491B
MKIFYSLYLILLSIIISGCKDYYTKQLIVESDIQHPIIFKNVNIFNGKDSLLLLDKDVVVDKGVVKTITENFIVANDDEYHIINGKGKTIMPGMIDAHVHLSGSGAVPWKNVKTNEAYNLEAYLHSGITTVYDLGGMASDIKDLSRKVEHRKIIGPTVYHTHIPITVKNGHPIPLTKEVLKWPLRSFVNTLAPTIEKVEDVEETITKYLKNNVDYVKIIYDQIPPGAPEMTFEVLKALIDEVHEKGYKVFVHIGSPQNAVDAVNAGADILAHGIWRGKLTAEEANTIAQSKVPVIYTLAAFINVNAINKGQFYPKSRDTLVVPKIILDPVMGKNGLDVESQEAMNAFFDDVTDKNEYLLHNFKLLKERNVQMILGTDSSLPGTYAGSTYLQEIDALKAYGLSNFDILAGGTYHASRLFLEDPDFGSIEPGKKANLLLIDGNPLENIGLIKSPVTIVMNGIIIEKLDD